MITLDLNHFGFQRAGLPERRKKSRGDSKRKRKSSQSRANLNGGELGRKMQSQSHPQWGELDCEYASGTHKGSH